MKKLFFTLGLACMFMVACNNTPKQQPEQQTEQQTEQTADAPEVVAEEHHCPMGDLRAEYENWDNLTDEAKAELNQKAMAVFNEMEAQMAAAQAAGEQVVEMTAEQKAECEAKCAEMKAKWENFATLDAEGQKALIMERLNGCKGGDKPCCHGDKPAETPAE